MIICSDLSKNKINVIKCLNFLLYLNKKFSNIFEFKQFQKCTKLKVFYRLILKNKNIQLWKEKPHNWKSFVKRNRLSFLPG